MVRWSLKRWLGVCLVATLLGSAGCGDGAFRPFRGDSTACPCQKPACPRVVAQCAPGRYTVPERCATPTVSGCKGTCGCPTCATHPSGVSTRILSASAAPPATPRPAGVPHPAARQAAPARPAAPAALPRGTPPTLPDPDKTIEQMNYRVVTPDTGHGRRAYVDVTVQPWFDCAEDHSWLTGQVLYDAGTNTWRLHYASVDDSDAYGGTVTLTGGDKLKALKDGQAVRVQGHLLDPDRRQPESPYEVSSFEVLDKS